MRSNNILSVMNSHGGGEAALSKPNVLVHVIVREDSLATGIFKVWLATRAGATGAHYTTHTDKLSDSEFRHLQPQFNNFPDYFMPFNFDKKTQNLI